MEYYGDLNKKRLMVVANYKLKDIADITSEIGYINSKGLLLDYTLKQFTEGYIHNNKQGDIHPCNNKKPWVIYSDCWSDSKTNKRNKKTYYTGELNWNGNKLYAVFMELPRIANDGTFTWKENRKYGTLEATIKSDNFEYLCISKMDGNAFVEVKYTKQENKHRNNVTVARIEVYNASNEDILAAIKKWQNEIISGFTRKEITA